MRCCQPNYPFLTAFRNPVFTASLYKSNVPAESGPEFSTPAWPQHLVTSQLIIESRLFSNRMFCRKMPVREGQNPSGVFANVTVGRRTRQPIACVPTVWLSRQ